MEIKYTIIIPHYNSPDSLSKLLYSIPLAPEIQVIVIDDNSTKELDQLEQVKQDNTRCEFYINTTGIQSAGACRNTGLTHAQGKWVLFADSDDYFIDGLLEHLEHYYDDPSDVIFFTPTSLNTTTRKVSSRHVLYAGLVKNYLKKPSRKNEINLRYRFGVPWSKMIRRDVIVQNQLEFEPVSVSNDIMFSTKLGNCMRSFQVTDRIIYCVTKSTKTLTTTVKESNLDTRVEVLIRRYGFLRAALSKKDFKKLEPTSNILLFEALMGFGFKKFVEVFTSFRKNKIKLDVFSYSYFVLAVRVFKDRIGLYSPQKKRKTTGDTAKDE